MAINIEDPYSMISITPNNDWDIVEPVAVKGSINKWSFIKPVIADDHTELINPDGFYAVNDGFTIKGYSTPMAAIQSAINGATDNWKYTRPVDGVNWGRITDWIGYNHSDKQSWFNLTISPTSGRSGTAVTVKLHNRGFITGTFINFACMSSYKNAITSQPSNNVLSYGLIFQKKNSTNTAIFYKYCSNTGLGNISSDTDFAFTVPSSVLTSGDYYVMPTITTYTNMNDNTFVDWSKDNDSYTWWAFPFDTTSKPVFTVGSATIDVLGGIDATVYFDGYMQGSTYYLYSVYVILSSSLSSAYNIGVQLDIVDYEGGTIQPPGTSSELISTTAYIPAGQDWEDSVNFDKNEYGYISFQYMDSPRLRLILSYGGNEKTEIIELDK